MVTGLRSETSSRFRSELAKVEAVPSLDWYANQDKLRHQRETMTLYSKETTAREPAAYDALNDAFAMLSFIGYLE